MLLFHQLRRSAFLSVSILAMMAATTHVALAQNDQLQTENITVTGTFLTHGTSVTPVTTLSVEELTTTGPLNLADALNTLPQIQASPAPSHSASGFQGANVLNLRELESSRTLVLVDGQRFVPDGLTYDNETSSAVNVDLLPQGLVKGVDIVTGGASASYGSDAVSGVINFVLDNEFTGIKLDGLIGETQYLVAKTSAC